MIKLLQYLACTLPKENLLELAMFLSDNPDVIDQETLMHIINEVDGWHVIEDKPEPSKYQHLVDKMKNIDEIRINDQLYQILKDNNINLN
tara:strand:- start:471 stop:740 length:270 start_codon:yes stop_codon:yes gene_type:complete